MSNPWDKKRGKKKKKEALQVDERTIQCGHCGATHRALDGGWVVNGLGMKLCQNYERDCFDEVRKLRASAAREPLRLSLDD